MQTGPNSKVVKIHECRGYGNGMWQVLSRKQFGTGEHLELRNLHGTQEVLIYTYHTYVDKSCMLAEREMVAEIMKKNSKIGLAYRKGKKV